MGGPAQARGVPWETCAGRRLAPQGGSLPCSVRHCTNLKRGARLSLPGMISHTAREGPAERPQMQQTARGSLLVCVFGQAHGGHALRQPSQEIPPRSTSIPYQESYPRLSLLLEWAEWVLVAFPKDLTSHLGHCLQHSGLRGNGGPGPSGLGAACGSVR